MRIHLNSMGKRKKRKIDLVNEAIERTHIAQARYKEKIDRKLANGARRIYPTKTNPVKTTKARIIGIKDFVIWGNTFKCLKASHNLRDIDARIKVINKEGELSEIVVAAGYCGTCHVFFLKTSTFRALQTHGVLVCRLINEKTYYKQNVLFGNTQLAQESILKQFGYSVSQKDSLSDVK